MKTQIFENIEILKERLEMNKKIIVNNHDKLKTIIEQPCSSERTKLFQEHFRTNTELHSHNNALIKLQFELQRALSPYYTLKTFGAMSLS